MKILLFYLKWQFIAAATVSATGGFIRHGLKVLFSCFDHVPRDSLAAQVAALSKLDAVGIEHAEMAVVACL